LLARLTIFIKNALQVAGAMQDPQYLNPSFDGPVKNKVLFKAGDGN